MSNLPEQQKKLVREPKTKSFTTAKGPGLFAGKWAWGILPLCEFLYRLIGLHSSTISLPSIQFTVLGFAISFVVLMEDQRKTLKSIGVKDEIDRNGIINLIGNCPGSTPIWIRANWLPNVHDFAEILAQAKRERGCDVRIILPDKPTFAVRITERCNSNSRFRPPSYEREVEYIQAALTESVRLSEKQIHHTYFRIGDQVIIANLLFGDSNLDAYGKVGISIAANSTYGQIQIIDFEQHWNSLLS